MTDQGISISRLAIRRHIGTLVLSLAVVVLGLFAVTRLQVDLLPGITYPRIAVQLNIPGIAPEVAVDEVTKPLEASLAATEGVTQIFSRTQEGRVRVDLFFAPGSNLDQALNDVTATYNRGRSRLPDNIEDARIFKFDPSQLPVYEFALTSPSLSPLTLRIFAEEELARELSVVPGVAAVDVVGGQTEEVTVKLDFARLQAQGLTVADVLTALQKRNQDISGGRLAGKIFEPLTRTIGRFASVQEIEELSLTVNGKQVYLRDFATVTDGSAEQRLFVTLNGEPAVKVTVQKQPDANTIVVVDGVKQKLEQLKQQGLIPPDAVLTVTLDDSRFIRSAIKSVVQAGVTGAILAALAVLLFLGSLRQTLIILISIPLSILAAVIVMALCNFSLNLFSLGGLALGVGIVVDNSIVMLESIAVGTGMAVGQSASSLGWKDTIERAIISSQKVESALVASTATNIVAVLPFLLIGGFISLLFNELVLTIVFAVAASIVVAVTVVPALASRLLAVRASSGIGRWWLFRQFHDWFTAATDGYGWLLKHLLRWRLLVLSLTFIICGVSSWWMARQVPQEILPPINTGLVNIIAQFPAGTTLNTNQQVMTMVEDILRQEPETQYIFATIGGVVFGNNATANPLRSSTTITLKPGSDVFRYVEKVKQKLNKLNLAGIRLRVNPGRVRGIILNNSPTPGTEIDVLLQGNDLLTLERTGRQILRTLEEKVTGANFRPETDARQPEIQINPNWERLERLGLTVADLGQTITTAIIGSVPTQLQRGNRLVDVRVRLDRAEISEPSQLEQLPLFTREGQTVRLCDVAQIKSGTAPGEILRVNQKNVFVISGNLNRGASLSQAIQEVEQTLKETELPPGITILPSSAAEANRQLQQSLQVLGLLATFLVFVVMAVQYNSLIDPLVIMFTVPLALAGGILGLFVTKTAIGATVVVGAVLLVGIVVNNAIIMVELANQIKEETGCDRLTAITQAAPQRLRPILMTTITTVLGLFPLALGLGEGSEFLRPLGIVVFSGLSFATLLTLFIIPCFYLLLHEIPTPTFRAKNLRPKRQQDVTTIDKPSL
ncbi:MAG: efflux RND transporter permease subunit [Pseudanabaenaceae cyanobacterium SKYGB_i_bin29]|nr:efflux RND transporter permease subunit [Pseudanabaenaceae cyanobacterium SKYG29]MDW8422051.1 efflux RND transporter permease subunit [Pseudanabaenaceae cyanobacterium SKYGB_i_bin29]